MIEFANFVPKELQASEIYIREDFAEVVERLRKFLPPNKIWELFSSTPGETGGRIEFPYSRVDAAAISARDNIWMINHFKGKLTQEEIRERFLAGSKQAFEAITWVEIGFEGLQNLAVSPASLNWTSAVGHIVTPEERADRIMTSGKEMYDKCLGSFVRFRKNNNMNGDNFEEFGLEYLLDPFLKQQNM